jgi:hypothetical protein
MNRKSQGHIHNPTGFKQPTGLEDKGTPLKSAGQIGSKSTLLKKANTKKKRV